MKISSSAVEMSSTHKEFSYSHQEMAFIEARASSDLPSAILTISEEGLNYKESLEEYQKREDQAFKDREQQNAARNLQRMAEEMKAHKDENQYAVPEEDNIIKVIRRMLAILRGEDVPDDCKIKPGERQADYSLSNSSSEFSLSSMSVSAASASFSIGGLTASDVPSNAWERIMVASGYHAETELTTFNSTGFAHTEDGRNINFNIELSMSRAFMEETNFMQTELFYKIEKDPLVINVGSNVTKVSDMKFLFDIDGDGKKENISFAGEGSGFLALDKNEDGIINDGTELFGTKSGDGFKDLAKYDSDGNGWIDENDSVFSKLKVWFKDENGKDVLLSLKEADVGAIYLGNAKTQFQLKNDEHQLNGEIRKTGIYLKESSGMAGTIAHVDLVV